MAACRWFAPAPLWVRWMFSPGLATLALTWKLGLGPPPRKAAFDFVNPGGVVVEGYPSWVGRQS